ncbi:MAG: helix-turn-helix transcriptional regulator [Clostridia bacterium]|nr:helix-turn-helix transcriptional regulator [Clostridia bacterium]
MIGEIIKELRTDKGISQKQLADVIGVGQATVSEWERSVNEPKASYIEKLADYFNISTDYLFGRNDT